MIIDFECSGGFANLRWRYRVNTDELGPEEAADLRQLVERTGIMGLKAAELAPKSPGPPDVMQYRITISHMGTLQSLEINDITAPPALRPLLTRLQELAAEQKGKDAP
jgi:hypothetical protein